MPNISRSATPVNGISQRRALFLLACLLLGMLYLAWAATWVDAAEDGQALFQAKCSSCHTIGGGTLVGPDLKGVTTLRDPAWLTRWLLMPDKMLAEKDPIAIQLLAQYNNIPMPNMGLTDAQAAAIIAYLASASAAGGATGQPATTPFPGVGTGTGTGSAFGDPVAGRALFTGARRLQNGGPACIACHTVAGIGELGGGQVGPDLTGAYAKYGATGLPAVLASIPFPTMLPIFTAHPLTAVEQADLVAFLAQPMTAPPANSLGVVLIIMVVGAALLLILAQIYWRRRLTTVRRSLLKNAKTSL